MVWVSSWQNGCLLKRSWPILYASQFSLQVSTCDASIHVVMRVSSPPQIWNCPVQLVTELPPRHTTVMPKVSFTPLVEVLPTSGVGGISSSPVSTAVWYSPLKFPIGPMSLMITVDPSSLYQVPWIERAMTSQSVIVSLGRTLRRSYFTEMILLAMKLIFQWTKLCLWSPVFALLKEKLAHPGSRSHWNSR